ncbi:MAG TPA: DUF2326 domain-containing protein [Fimbriimonadaceae bacterium]|nr:DUF2326 domain-containing protein [Fimbriimonadaceae bacterium]
MKLSRLYSNKPTLFVPIEWNRGLNVVYANVTRPKEDDKDSHNLGKTLLIHLIDFMLLKESGPGHFLYDNKATFSGFEFFLELELNDGGYITVSRGVDKPSKISFKRHADRNEDFSNLAEPYWDKFREPFTKSTEFLNQILNLDTIKPYAFRKGVSYFLRTQADYLDVFQLSKFMKGRHADWKPFMALLLGFNWKLVDKKYEVDEEIVRLEKFAESYEQEAGASLEHFDRVKGLLQIKRAELDELQAQTERFNYLSQELKLNYELVSEVERRVAELNEQLYSVNYEIQNIGEALRERSYMDLKKVEELFAELNIYFPERLHKDYEALLEFNRRLFEERNERLEDRARSLESDRARIEVQLREQNNRREELLAVVHEEDWFRRYQSMQADIGIRHGEVIRLEAELSRLDVLTKNERQLEALRADRADLVARIRENVNEGNATYTYVRSRFNVIVRGVLDLPALLSSTVNTLGNIDFDASLILDEASMKFTSEGKGTSYKKLLCAAFDMSVLEAYSQDSFYRFVYHDGILEGLDNRKKQKFLAVVEEFCKKFGLQYILTVIDADLPRDAQDKKVPFADEAVVLELHEGGDAGRLFKMPKF